MPESNLLALYNSPDNAANAVSQLHQLGIPDDNITIMSGLPYRAPVMGHGFFKGKVGLFSLGGAVLGLILALLFTAGFWLLWPLRQGGQPIIPIPPTLIIIFELTMLGTMWATFFGMLWLDRFPQMDNPPYDPRITDGMIGVLAKVGDKLADQAEQSLKSYGAVDVTREELFPRRPTYNFFKFWGGLAFIGTIAIIILGLFVYDVIRIPFPTNMDEQNSVAYEQGPRLAAPAEAVPVQGPVLIAGVPASLPLPATQQTLERGQLLYALNCQLCHGPQGQGNGPVSGFFNPKPADLSSATIQKLSDDEIFLVITEGKGAMPSIRENLLVADRWSVIAYVRTLKK